MDRSRASRIKSIAGQVLSPGVVTFSLTIDGVTKRIKARVLKSFDWTLLLSLPTQADFDIMIKTRQRKAITSSDAFCNHIQEVVQLDPPVLSNQTMSSPPVIDSAVNEWTTDPAPDPTIFQLFRYYENLLSKLSSELELIKQKYHHSLSIEEVAVKRSPNRLSFQEAEETARQVKELTAKGLTRQSPSAFTKPSILTDPKDGLRRFVPDYRPVHSKKIPVQTSKKDHTQPPKSPLFPTAVKQTIESRERPPNQST